MERRENKKEGKKKDRKNMKKKKFNHRIAEDRRWFRYDVRSNLVSSISISVYISAGTVVQGITYV